VKLLALALFTATLFALKSPTSLAIAALIPASLIASGGASFARESARMLRPLLPIVLVIALWHLILRDPGGVAILLRLITAVAVANFVTMTTRLADMISVIECIARPLRPILSPRTLALAIALTIRFVPTLLVRAEQIRQSWRARSPRRPGWRTLLPTTLAALDDADRVAEALRARGGLD